MVISQYASGRNVLPFSSSNIVVSAGGSLTAAVAGTYYFCIQGENRVGLSLQSTIVGPINVVTGQQIQITIPAEARGTGEEWHSFIVSANTSSDETSFKQLAKYRGFSSPGIPSVLPATITISRDEHLKLAPTVNAPINLPVGTDLRDGMVRGVASLSTSYYYEQSSVATVDNTNVLSAAIGRWLRIGSQFTYQPDTKDPGGCDQEIFDISEEVVRCPTYAATGGAGEGVGFFITNDTDEPIPSGTRLGIVFELNDTPQSAIFTGLFKVVVKGYTDLTTGVLRTTDSLGQAIPGVGAEYNYEPRKTGLVLGDELQPNEAFYFQVIPNFRPEQLNGFVPNNTFIKCYPIFYSQAGEYTEAGALLGNCIFAEDDRRRILPGSALSLKALKGSGLVDSYSFKHVAQDTIYGLLPNTANQKVLINGNGATFLKDTDIDILESEAVRAIVSTELGTTNPSVWSSNFTLTAGGVIDVTANYPCTSNGVGTVRTDYPDVIAGNSKAVFNPESIYIYVQQISSGIIKRYSSILIPDTNQIIPIASWTSGTIVGTLPTSPSADFGLFAPGNVSGQPLLGGSNFPAGDYRVAYAFNHTGNSVSKITHSESLDCIHEAAFTISDISQSSRYWASSVASTTALRELAVAETYNTQTRIISSRNKAARYFPDSLAVDDGTATSIAIKPNELLASQPGRWIVDNSSTWYNGSGVPSGTLGAIGDYYIDSVSGTLYEKKTSSSWQSFTVIRGSKWYSDAGAPSGTLGSIDDFYINRTNNEYFKKTGTTTWSSQGFLKGDKGEVGSVTSASDLKLQLTNSPNTSSSQVSVYADNLDGKLKLKTPNNASEETFAFLTEFQVYSRGQVVGSVNLSSATNIPVDLSLSNTFILTLATNATLQTPSNQIAGGTYIFIIKQDSTGSRTLNYSVVYKFESGIIQALSTAPNSVDIMNCISDGTNMYCSLHKGFA